MLLSFYFYVYQDAITAVDIPTFLKNGKEKLTLHFNLLTYLHIGS